MARDPDSIQRIVEYSVVTKLMHVHDDMMEKSKRLILNYGHTFGQAIESFYGFENNNLLHGEAVALGLVVAAEMACHYYDNAESLQTAKLIKNMLKLYDLPVHITDLKCQNQPTPQELIFNLKNDKKRTTSANRFILANSLGKPNIVSLGQDYEGQLIASYKAICE